MESHLHYLSQCWLYRLDFDLHYLDLFEALDAGEVKGVEAQDWKYESPPEGWIKGWEEYKEMHIEFLADEWTGSLMGNDWKELADFIPEELWEHLEKMEPVEVEVLD